MNFLQTTLNNMGYSAIYPDVIQKSFIEYAASMTKPVLDIGAAFGVATIPALMKGAKVIANDLDERHLDAIKAHCPTHLLPNLTTLAGAIPEEIDFPNTSLDAVLVARVLHFLNPEQVLATLLKIHNWLSTNGKVFIVTTTPFIKILEGFIPIYEKRKALNEPFPGIVTDAFDYLSEDVKMPSFANLFDRETLEKCLINSRFHIESLFYFPAETPKEWLYDGREFLGCIAKKI